MESATRPVNAAMTGPRNIGEEVRRPSEHFLGAIFVEVTPGPNKFPTLAAPCLSGVRTKNPIGPLSGPARVRTPDRRGVVPMADLTIMDWAVARDVAALV